MNKWTDLLMDAASIKAIYGAAIPMLDGIDLHEIILHRDGPNATLRFDLKFFPKTPPKKWLSAGFNRVQLQLLASDIEYLQIHGWQTDVGINIKIDKLDSRIRLHASNEKFSIDLVFHFLILKNISAYLSTRKMD